TEQCNLLSVPWADELRDAADDLIRHAFVDAACCLDQFGDERIYIGEKVRIDRNAVSADAGAGRENVDARMRICEANRFPYVDAEFFREDCEFVCKRNIDVAKRVLDDFHELGDRGCRARNRSLAERRVEIAYDNGVFGTPAADDARVGTKFANDRTRN